MKTKILSIIALIFIFALQIDFTFGKVVDFGDSIGGGAAISDVSVNPVSGADTLEKAKNGTLGILHTIKVIFSGVILIYLVYTGFQMVMAMGAEDKLSAAKRQLYYTLLAFLFINVPGQLYEVFSGQTVTDATDGGQGYADVVTEGSGNLFVNFAFWNQTIENGLVGFIEVVVAGLVIMLFMMAGIGMILSGGNDENRKKAKNRFINGVLGLIFIGIIETWTQVVYSGDITGKGQSLFAKLANLALFFVGPMAIFFLILGGFYYITSAGDEAKAKKGIGIIKNTAVAIIILLASYAFLSDLADFTL